MDTSQLRALPPKHGDLGRTAWVIFSAAFLASSGADRPAAASDLRVAAYEGGQIADGGGVPCSAGAPFWAPPAATAAELPWRSVWLGHFSGGRPYQDAFGLTLVDWLDEKVCFPSQGACHSWVNNLRRAYHRPEGYLTCLLLR
jgi:hypothetical protein